MSAQRSEPNLEDGERPPAPADPPYRADLMAAWRKAYRNPPPKRTSTRLLTLAYAYHRQVAIHGGLSAASKQKLTAWANSSDGQSHQTVPPAKRGLATGTRLVRIWRGETHIVDVLADGVLYKATTYRSLSEVARAITGARWSGPRFFGL